MVYHLFHYQHGDCIEWPEPLRSFFERTDVTLVGYEIDKIITRLQQVCGEQLFASLPKTIDITRLRTMSEYDQVGKDAGMHSHTVTATLALIHYFYTHRSCRLDQTCDWVGVAIQAKQ